MQLVGTSSSSKNVRPGDRPCIAVIGELGGIRSFLLGDLAEAGFVTSCQDVLDDEAMFDEPGRPRYVGAVMGVSIEGEPKRRVLQKQARQVQRQLEDLIARMAPNSPLLVVVSAPSAPVAMKVDRVFEDITRETLLRAELHGTPEFMMNVLDVSGLSDYRLAASRITDYVSRRDTPVTGELASADEIREQSICSALVSHYAR